MFARYLFVAWVLLMFSGTAWAAPIHNAASQGDLREVMRLLKQDKSLARTADENGMTLLH